MAQGSRSITGSLRVFTANLYHAVELLAKSSLFKLGHEGLITSKKHEYIRSQYNLHSRSGIADPVLHRS